MSVEVARKTFDREADIVRFFDRVLKLESVNKIDWNITPPELIKDIWILLQEMSGLTDPLNQIKRHQNDVALKIYPAAKGFVMGSEDPFIEAIKWSATGNFIDIMKGAKDINTDDVLKKMQDNIVKMDNITELNDRLKKTKMLVYLCDNCGEVVFDRLLAEWIRENYDIAVTFVVKSVPVLNDATLNDALYAGLDNEGKVIENGIKEPIPGMLMDKISEELRTLIDRAELVISKGGGNYDTLSEYESLKGKVTFLMQAKCKPYSMIHRAGLGSLIIDNH